MAALSASTARPTSHAFNATFHAYEALRDAVRALQDEADRTDSRERAEVLYALAGRMRGAQGMALRTVEESHWLLTG